MNNLPQPVEKELTAREIFNRIVKGQVVRIPNDPVLAKQLYNHLNVIKSREKRIFADLGLDFISSVVSVEFIATQVDESKKTITPAHHVVKLVAPKKRRKFTAFVINDEQPSPI